MGESGRLEKQLVWVMACVLAAFFVSAGISIWASSNVTDIERQRGLAHARLEALNSLLLAFTNAETGQRGYLLTGNPSYLQPYYAAVTAANEQLARFHDVFPGEEGKQAYERLSALKEKKFSELAQTISLRNEHGLTFAMLVVNSNTGASYMADIREETYALRGRENRRLETLASDAARNVSIFQYCVTLFVLLLALAVLSVVTVVRHDTRTNRHLLQRLHHEATHDELTNLPNRNMYMQMLSYSIPFAHRYRRFLGVLFIDLDGFKQVNDRFGHDVGDMVLKEAAKRLREAARESDIVARIGGDEFLMLATNMTNVADIARIAQHVLSAFSIPLVNDLEGVHVGASIGIAVYPEHGASAAELIKAADTAMYEAKAAGKHRYAFCQNGEALQGIDAPSSSAAG